MSDLISRCVGGALMAVCLVGCGGDPRDSSILYRGTSANPDTVDPHKAEGSWENIIIGDMFIGLFTEDEQATPVPGAAQSWTVSDNGLVWTFTLRPMQWSDGKTVKASDFAFSMRRMLDPTTSGVSYASLLYVLRNARAVNGGQLPVSELGVRAIDDRTLELVLEYPVPYLPALLKHYVAWPVPEHVVKEHGDRWTRPENIVVNGPYKLAQWRTGDFLRSVKNPLFFDADNVCFEEVVYYPYSDKEAVIRMARTGRIDLNNDFPAHRVKELDDILPGWARLASQMSLTYLVFNTRKEPFSDPAVRLAMSMALDREFLASEILRGTQRPAYSFVPPGVNNYSEHMGDGIAKASFSGLDIQTRRDRARDLLIGAGYGPDRPLRFEMFYLSTGESPSMAPVMQSNWKDIADWVEPSIRRIETRVLYNQLQEGDFTASMAAWIADYSDPQNFLYLLQSTTGPMNYGQYSDLTFDTLLDAANNERDMKKRASLLVEAEKIILENAAVAPVTVRSSRNLVNPDIRGYSDNVDDIHRSRFMCRKNIP